MAKDTYLIVAVFRVVKMVIFCFVCSQMIAFRFSIVAVFACLQLLLLVNTVLGRPTKVITPSAAKTAAQRRSGSAYVDFGAHTGPLGSYGWYADFPAHKN